MLIINNHYHEVNLMLQNEYNDEALSAQVDALARLKNDVVLDTRDTLLFDGGSMLALRDSHYATTDHALSNIGNHLGIPMSYIEKLRDRARNGDNSLRDQMHSLIDHNFNSLLHNPTGKSPTRLFRTYRSGIDAHGRNVTQSVRSAHSNAYMIFDHDHVLRYVKMALKTLSQRHAIKFVSNGLTDSRLYIKIVFPDMQAEVKAKQVGDVVEAGIIISNSEIGMGSFVVRQFINRLVCTNGMVLPDYAGGMSRRHVGQRHDIGTVNLQRDTIVAQQVALGKTLRDNVINCVNEDRFKAVISKYNESAEDMAGEREPEDAMQSLGKKFGLTDEEVKRATRALISDNDYSRWGFANAVTGLAHKETNYDRATQLQELGGNVIQLSPREWHRVALAA